jgi:hypothetical protein
LLFNLADRAKPKVGKLDALVDFSGPGARKRRGVCKDKRSKSCRNHPSAAKKVECLANQGNCRGYTLRAGPKR